MAKPFGEVFSTTAKVVLSLLLLSAIISGGYFLLESAGRTASESQSSQAMDEALRDIDIERADANHTKVKKSDWDKMVKDAIAAKCPVLGMTKNEVAEVLGQPVSATNSE